MASFACSHISLRAARPSARQAPAASRGAAVFKGRAVRGSVSNGVKVSAWFKFQGNAEDAGIIGAQGRDEYIEDDVEQYFNYMGILAVEGTYDTLYEQLDAEIHPADIIINWAAAEGDLPKIEELLAAGANPNVPNTRGETAFDNAGKVATMKKDDVLQLLTPFKK